MDESKTRRMINMLIFDPIGIIGIFLLILGVVGIFLYGLVIAYQSRFIYDWRAWAYPFTFLLLSLIFLSMALCNIKRNAQSFLRDVKKEKIRLKNRMKKLESEKISGFMPESSEFGLNNLDVEVAEIIRETGGYIPMLIEEIKESPFSYEQARKSLAKLSLMGYIRMPEPEKKSDESLDDYIGCMDGVGLKITMTPRGLDMLELPKITFATMIPEDISLMLTYANLLYREGKSHMAILKCYTTLERALKLHLIPAIDGHEEKWDEHMKKKVKDDADFEIHRWKGVATISSLNELWNFYKKNSGLDRRWSDMTDRVVKYTTKEEKEIKKHLNALSKVEFEKNKEMGRISDRIVDVVADVRSKYAHDKPSEKYDKDAYRIIIMTDLVLGVLFEDFKEKTGIRGRLK